jgi:hypothetical protein
MAVRSYIAFLFLEIYEQITTVGGKQSIRNMVVNIAKFKSLALASSRIGCLLKIAIVLHLVKKVHLCLMHCGLS